MYIAEIADKFLKRGGVMGIDVSSGPLGISRTMYSESLLKDRYRPAPYGIFFEIRSNAADKTP